MYKLIKISKAKDEGNNREKKKKEKEKGNQKFQQVLQNHESFCLAIYPQQRMAFKYDFTGS